MRGREPMAMEGQAERWFARLLASDCSDAERAACAHWRRQSPAHDAAYRKAEAIWQQSRELLSEDPILAEALHEAEQQPASRATARFRPWLVPMAALVIVAVLATVLWTRQPSATRFETARGEQRSVDLPDGTQMVLDTQTALVTHYSTRQRFVEVETGQVLFQVAHDADRPFIVRVAGSTVTAVGTRFQVRSESGAATITLLEGAVTVEPASDGKEPYPATTLSPGQQLRFDREGRRSTNRVDLDVTSAWTRGMLVAKNRPLEDLVTELNRYTATPLRIADSTLAQERISGTFRLSDSTSLVLVLERTWSVRASRGAGNEIVLAREPTSRR
jgi:transmembrane sensor